MYFLFPRVSPVSSYQVVSVWWRSAVLSLLYERRRPTTTPGCSRTVRTTHKHTHTQTHTHTHSCYFTNWSRWKSFIVPSTLTTSSSCYTECCSVTDELLLMCVCVCVCVCVCPGLTGTGGTIKRSGFGSPGPRGWSPRWRPTPTREGPTTSSTASTGGRWPRWTHTHTHTHTHTQLFHTCF